MIEVIVNVSGFQHLTDDFQNSLVMYADSPQLIEQQPVVDIVKTAFNITLNCPYWLIFGFHTCIYDIDNISDCVLLCPVWAKPVAVRIKSRFAYRFENQSDTLLKNPV